MQVIRASLNRPMAAGSVRTEQVAHSDSVAFGSHCESATDRADRWCGCECQRCHWPCELSVVCGCDEPAGEAEWDERGAAVVKERAGQFDSEGQPCFAVGSGLLRANRRAMLAGAGWLAVAAGGCTPPIIHRAAPSIEKSNGAAERQLFASTAAALVPHTPATYTNRTVPATVHRTAHHYPLRCTLATPPIQHAHAPHTLRTLVCECRCACRAGFSFLARSSAPLARR